MRKTCNRCRKESRPAEGFAFARGRDVALGEEEFSDDVALGAPPLPAILTSISESAIPKPSGEELHSCRIASPKPFSALAAVSAFAPKLRAPAPRTTGSVFNHFCLHRNWFLLSMLDAIIFLHSPSCLHSSRLHLLLIIPPRCLHPASHSPSSRNDRPPHDQLSTL